MAEKAKILFEKFVAGTCSKQEFEELMQLLQEHKNEAYFRTLLNKVYQSVGASIKSDICISRDGNFLYHHDNLSDRKIKLKRIIIGISTAAIILLTIGTTWFLNKKSDSQSYQERKIAIMLPVKEQDGVKQHTTRAEQKHLLLPDGSQVWLNAESSLDIPKKFDDKQRVVYLSGEAFFDIKHADKIPFIIHTANNITTRVLGTAFDIKAYANQPVLVAVKRGLVKVSKNKKILATLSLGQQLSIAHNDKDKPVIKQVRDENVASWTEGKLVYESMSYEDIVSDLERVYNVQITIGNDSLKKELITSSFNQKDGIETVLKTLCVLTNASFKEEMNNKYIIN